MSCAMQADAVSHWPDADDLNAKARRLITQPPRPIRRNRMAAILEYFETRCKGSKKSTSDAAKRIPGGVIGPVIEVMGL